MATKADLETALKAMLGASAKFWPSPKDNPKLDDYYEAYLWAETVQAARGAGWTVLFLNAGAASNEFKFRMGPGIFKSATPFTFARFKAGVIDKGELHIGIRVKGNSGVLHEFDVLGIDQHHATLSRQQGTHPHHSGTRLHVEAKFHKADLSLGVGRAIVGLKCDCPSIHPFLVSRAEGAKTIRTLIKHYGGTYVHNAFPTDTGIGYLRSCLQAAVVTWK
ncbi:hypothetical protein [Sphingomonas sp. R86520]|uniref:hypothetical protein n=1 Tax=Sphingomonas sp. R86520 TaxID=3093859 RepID=UPI0036D29946